MSGEAKIPYEKQKTESYQAFGGINIKASPYLTGPHECLDLVNYDFSVPGAWTQRPGSTQYTGSTFLSALTGLYEFQKLSGVSQVIAATSSTLYAASGTTFIPVKAFSTVSTTPFDFVTFVDTLFLCNGSVFLKYGTIDSGIVPVDGVVGLTNVVNYSLPAPTAFAYTLPVGLSSGVTGLYSVALGFFNANSYFGPVSSAISVSLDATHHSVLFTNAYIPGGYGINSVVTYGSEPNGSQLFLAIPSKNLVGYTLSIQGGTMTLSSFPGQVPGQFSAGSIDESFDVNNDGLFFTLSPKCLELYNNQLFMAGFTAYTNAGPFGTLTINYQSRLYWSGIGQPEFIDPTYFAEVRTNDGYGISALKLYASSLMVFKQTSTHQLTGNSETDILIRDVSDQYGALSNAACVVFNQRCLFLDRKGICEFDGSNVKIVSSKVEAIFQRMNVDAAIDQATAIHFKKRNEVWFNIPIDGSTLINMSVIYDYLMDSWTTFQGYHPSVMTMARGRLSDLTSLFGDYSGLIHNFGASLPGDNGQGLTTIVKTYFHHDLGESVTKQWRRLFMNVDPVVGSTASLNVDLIPDYGTSIAISRPMYLNPFQSRIDFGIPSKSLQMQFTSFSSTLFIKIFGYTIESRFQRKV